MVMLVPLGQAWRFLHFRGMQLLYIPYIWRIHYGSQTPALSTKMLLSQQKTAFKDSTAHSIHFVILNCLCIQHHGAAEHQDLVFTLESILERFTHVALTEEFLGLGPEQLDLIQLPGLQNSSEQTPKGSMTGCIK